MDAAQDLQRRLGHSSVGCAVCGTTCAEIDRLRLLVRDLEDECQRLAYALLQERELRDFARSEIETRFLLKESKP